MRLPLALALLLLAALPGALAQVAPPSPCGPLAAVAASPQNGVAPGTREDVVVAVFNNGSRAAQVTVSVSDPTAGWLLVNPEDQVADVAPGASASFSFTVEPTDAATGDLGLSFQVQGECALPVPGTSCPNNACTATAPATGATVRLDRPAGGGIPGLGDLGFPLEYLVAGVVLVGVATAIPFLLRKKRGGFLADCPEPLKLVPPGRGTSFPIEVRNASAEPVTAQFDIGPVPDGWTAFMPLPEVQLAPRESRSLWLMVRAPPFAAEGDAAEVELRLRSATRPDVASVLRVRAEVNPRAAEGNPPPL